VKQSKLIEKRVDVAVIGAGPAGLTAAIYAARAGVKTLVLEGKSASKLDLDYKVENFPGFISINSRDLLTKFREHAQHFGAEISENDVIDVNLSLDPKYLLTKRMMLQAGAVVLATGRPAGGKHQLPGEAPLIGKGVSYCATCDGPFFRGKKALAVGNTDEAAQDVLTLDQMGVKVEWVTGDGREPQVAEELQQQIREKAIPVHSRGVIKRIVGEERLEAVILDLDEGEQRLPVEGVFMFRDVSFSALYQKAGLEIDARRCVLINPAQSTNLAGVYAAGDISCGGKQIVTAAGEGARAAMEALKYLRSLE